MSNIKNFVEFVNESNIPRYHDSEVKKKIKISDIKIGDKIKFNKSTKF